MEVLGMDGMWLVSILKLRMYIMLKTIATGLELKSGVCDCTLRKTMLS